MFKRILIPTDGSALSERAVAAGVALAKAVGAEVLALRVQQPFHTFSLDPEMLEETAARFRRDEAARADGHLAFVTRAANAAGVACSVETTIADEPWQAIIDSAGARQCDLIVMASHGRKGVAAALLGSETQKVLVYSKIPVLVVR